MWKKGMPHPKKGKRQRNAMSRAERYRFGCALVATGSQVQVSCKIARVDPNAWYEEKAKDPYAVRRYDDLFTEELVKAAAWAAALRTLTELQAAEDMLHRIMADRDEHRDKERAEREREMAEAQAVIDAAKPRRRPPGRRIKRTKPKV